MKDEATEKSRCGCSRRNVLMASVAAGAALLVGLPKGAPGGEAPGTPADAPEYAVDRFMKSMNCSQAVLETYAPSMGMPEDIAKRVAAAFAGGMGMGSECGAVTGAFLVIGMKYGKTKDKDSGSGREDLLQGGRVHQRVQGSTRTSWMLRTSRGGYVNR